MESLTSMTDENEHDDTPAINPELYLQKFPAPDITFDGEDERLLTVTLQSTDDVPQPHQTMQTEDDETFTVTSPAADDVPQPHQTEDDETFSVTTPAAKKIRDKDSGKFVRKKTGTDTDFKRRQKDVERKRLSRGLKVFEKMAAFANDNEDVQYFAVIKKGEEVHFSGSEDMVKNFKENKNILNFTDSMIETREESILQKIIKAKIKENVVQPSPYKGAHGTGLGFLPGCSKIPPKDLQHLELTKMTPTSGEDLVAISKDTVMNLKSRIFLREKRNQ
ncbi:uncharacterized protein LOC134268931 [Saccostrea cucullata]|uniref:uncharacterized protein LOC134268931 n=1 Tax=Saccostrea cuccullata TaxID=36930 RepID=UPI002ED5EF6E